MTHDLIINFNNEPGEAIDPTPLEQRPPHTIGCPIVKVQMSQFSSVGPAPRCLVYSQDRKEVLFEGEATQGMVVMMRGRPKAFFYTARAVGPANQGKLTLLALEAPWQDW